MALWVESRGTNRGQAAFELLWERHRAASHAAVRRLLGRHAAHADDVLQDTWLEVARAESYRPGSFAGYLRTIAARKALDRLASARVRARAVDPEGDAEEVALPASSPAARAQARQAAGAVLELVAGMPEPQRIAWTLRYVEELGFEEVAAAMGTPLGTAKTRVRLANAYLADALSASGLSRADLEVSR